MTLASLALPAQAIGVVAILAAFWRAQERGPLWSLLHTYLLLALIVLSAWRLIDLIRGQLSLRAYREPKAHGPQLVAGALRVAVWLLMGLAVHVGIPILEFRTQGESTTKAWIAAGVLATLSLLPRRRRWAPGDVLFSLWFCFLAFDLTRAFREPTYGALDVHSPFQRPSQVYNGGASALTNEHVHLYGRAGAMDLFLLTRGYRLCAGEGLPAFPTYGAAVFAPVAGEVVRVVSDRPDMPIWEVDREVPSGNSITIRTRDGRYLLLGYLQRGSSHVREGDQVSVGEPLARGGNSGEASVPSLLLQAQDRASAAPGEPPLRTFPLRFVDAIRMRGRSLESEPFLVRRSDIIMPLPPEDLEPPEDLDEEPSDEPE